MLSVSEHRVKEVAETLECAEGRVRESFLVLRMKFGLLDLANDGRQSESELAEERSEAEAEESPRTSATAGF